MRALVLLLVVLLLVLLVVLLLVVLLLVVSVAYMQPTPRQGTHRTPQCGGAKSCESKSQDFFVCWTALNFSYLVSPLGLYLQLVSPLKC